MQLLWIKFFDQSYTVSRIFLSYSAPWFHKIGEMWLVCLEDSTHKMCSKLSWSNACILWCLRSLIKVLLWEDTGVINSHT